jgi:hypothetical protein|tara:strand:- start:14579 stop:14812 length:234 start_codon:yes stop_codon:yes gene_type:complete
MKNGKQWNILGVPILKIITKDKNYKNSILKQYKIVIFNLLLVSIGYSSFEGDSILIQIGISKLELFTSFTIKNRWLR